MRKSAMTTSRVAPLSALLLALASCTPSVPQSPSPASVVSALFDPATGEIPLPNDLVLQSPATLPLPAAEKELLGLFATPARFGFPNDQEVAVTVSFARDQINADGSLTRVAPAIDPASFTPSSFFVFGVTSNGTVRGEIPMDPIAPGDLVIGPGASGGQVTTLTLHHKGRTPWAPGSYAVLIRGGANGVKTMDGEPVYASPVFFLVAQGQDMTRRENLILLQAQSPSYDAALALAQQLNAIIQGYQPAYAACDLRFPHQELASLVGFTVAPAQTQVDLDPGRGLVPLPIDLLRDPRPVDTRSPPPTDFCAACGHLTPLAACTLAAGTFDPATQTCSSAASAGFSALDGFSTTAPLLAPTNDLVDATSVTSASYKLYDLTVPSAPVLVDPSTYLIEPVEFTSSGFSPVVASQPVGATAADASSPFRSKPLKDNTSYAVVITTGVKDKTGAPLGRGTVGSILLFDNPLSVGGVSQLTGIDDATAYALEAMRLQLLPVRTALAAATPAVPKASIAMAYTFKTQSFKQQAVQLGALPYTMAPASALPGAVTSLTPAAAFAKYGVDATAVPSSNIAELLETTITTFNLLDLATGAFHAGAPVDETIKVLIAVPKTAPPCTGAMAPFGTCAPMMVFRHGLGGGRVDMLTVADTYAAKGMVTVSIDAAKHGDRSFCAKGDTTISVGGGTFPVCADGAACVSPLPAGAQGDAKPPGTCTAGFTTYPVSQACLLDPAGCGWTGANGIPLASSSFLVTANFFRTRDTLRQDIIDQSQLIRAIAFAPSGLPPTGNTVFDQMVASGRVIDPAQVYYSGQSMGAIQGTVDVAANPRITRAALNVGGGTLVDIFTTSPAFVSGVDALLAGMGISHGTSQYLQFLAVAKLILDPADPINYAVNLTTSPLPNLLPPLGGATDGSVPQAPKRILTQVALCDQTVPNTWSYVLAGNAGTSPLPVAPTFGLPGTFQLFAMSDGNPSTIPAAIQACGVPGATTGHAVEHGFFTDWTFSPGATLKAQQDAADFVLSSSFLPASLVVIP
jgi:hypothetical protein